MSYVASRAPDSLGLEKTSENLAIILSHYEDGTLAKPVASFDIALAFMDRC